MQSDRTGLGLAATLASALTLGLAGCQAPLQQTDSCDEVLDAIQLDALAKVALQVQAVETDLHWGVVAPLDGGVALPPAGVSEPPDSEVDAPSAFSDTNRQVAGVDEADIVKVGDGGRKLYVIRGNGFYVFDSWPAAQTSKLADLEIEGTALEMFVEGERAVVFSSVYGVEGLDGTACSPGPIPLEPLPLLVDDASLSWPCGRPYVKLTVIDLAEDAPVEVRGIYVAGTYTSSRRHGDIVRAVVQSDVRQPASVPELWEYLTRDGQYPESRNERVARARAWAQEARVAILATSLEQWLPPWGESRNGRLRRQALQCDGFHVPAPGLASYGLTQVVGLDVAEDAAARIASILGWASQVYANDEALILTQNDHTWVERGAGEDRTAVHRFGLSSESVATRYEGSGFVPGVVNDQFSIDEKQGVIRIATTRTTWSSQPLDPPLDVWTPPVTDNLVSTLELREGVLEVIGKTPPLAEGERIFSARFVGDVGYVVTFRRVDPLWAIDLSDPEDPRVLGELEIPGFSDYMHPLGADHLLTIGRDVDENTQVDRGTALQIFDVSNPVSPRLTHKELVGNGFSEANHDHKAFNFYADQGVLAFPFVSYEAGFESTLELWAVDPRAGLDRLGSLDHSALVLGDCPGWNPPGGIPFDPVLFEQGCGYEPQVKRGVFIDDFVYSISDGGVLVHALDDLSEAVASATY